jgi:AcrR family transcriptional regulator
MSSRGERTRERILDAAELLYAERGIDGVSLREIRLAAGQRNSSALQFHFGDADGVLRALATRHMPRIAELADQVRDRVAPAGSRPGPDAMLEVLVRPWAVYLGHGPHARAWVRIAAETSARPERMWHEFLEHSPAVFLEAGATLLDLLQARVGPRLALDRLTRVNLAALHLCADRARLMDATPRPDMLVLPDDDWAHDLVATSVAALLAPATIRSHAT